MHMFCKKVELGRIELLEQFFFDRYMLDIRHRWLWPNCKERNISLIIFVPLPISATPGYLSTYAGNRFPGAEGSPSGLQALWNMSLTDYLWIFGTCAILEICNSDRAGTSEFRGDWRNGFDFGWDKQTDEWKTKKRAIELNQGRAAQMGILGLIVHDAMGNLNEIFPTP